MFEENIKEYLEKHGFGTFAPKAVLFDMDGVLYDSMSHHARAWHESMRHYGLAMTEEEAYEHEGMRGVETIQKLAKAQGHQEIDEAKAQEIYDYKSALFAAQGPAHKMEGVEELMRAIVADGLLIGIVTGSGQHTLLDHLEQEFSGLIFKERIVTAYDVTRGKPAPMPYLKGLEKCGAQPWEAIVVENAPLGVRAANAAQIFTVAVNTGPLPDHRLLDEGADLLFRRMTDFRDHWHDLSSHFNHQSK